MVSGKTLERIYTLFSLPFTDWFSHNASHLRICESKNSQEKRNEQIDRAWEVTKAVVPVMLEETVLNATGEIPIVEAGEEHLKHIDEVNHYLSHQVGRIADHVASELTSPKCLPPSSGL